MANCCNLHDITRPMVVNGRYLAQKLASGVIGRKAYQIGMIVFVIGQGGQAVTGHEKAGAAQRFGRIATCDARNPRAKAART